MAHEFKIPELGENIESGTIAKIIVTVGDKIVKEQALIELETDKAVIEVPSDVTGTISKTLVSEGDDVRVGQPIFIIDESAGASVETKIEAEQTPAEKVMEKIIDKKKETDVKSRAESNQKILEKTTSDVFDFVIPELGENIESGTIAKILVSIGDIVEKEQGLLELETDKAVVEIPSEVNGTVKEILVKDGDEVKIGQKVLSIETHESEVKKSEAVKLDNIEEITKEQDRVSSPEVQPKPEKILELKVPPISTGKIAPAAPSVRRFAREIGVNINQIAGSGPGGRISIDDVKNYVKLLNKQEVVSDNILTGIEAEALPDFSKWGNIEIKPMNRVREKTAKHLGFAWATIPHVTQFDKADITELEKLRKEYGKKVESGGGKLTVTVILMKVVSAAFKVYPQFNASIDLSNKQIIYKQYHNIGVAVDTDRGLLVPVIRDVDQKNLIELSVEITNIAEKARQAKLSLEDMQGGNFSISNLGGIGGTGFTPVVHSPEVAILGVSRSQMEQVYLDGEFKPRLMLPLSLSYDHRLIDGADAARFLRWVCEALEKPFMILLEG